MCVQCPWGPEGWMSDPLELEDVSYHVAAGNSVADAEGHNLGGFYFNIATPLEEYWRKHPQE